jgi:hypothetical protein
MTIHTDACAGTNGYSILQMITCWRLGIARIRMDNSRHRPRRNNAER